MLLAIIFYNVWGVLQLAAVGSFARTVRVRTVLSAIVVGMFLCAPLAMLVESTLAGTIATLTGQTFGAVNAVAGYTVHPVIEEIIRILPLALLLLVPVVRRQLSVTDCVLIGAATGAGFGLAEDLFRFGSTTQHAMSVAGGWVVPFQTPYGPASGIRVFIPSIGTALGSWLPDMGGVRLFAPYLLPNLLLIWSAIGGLAVGLWLRLDGPKRWYLAVALIAYASGAHAASNADITLGRELDVTAPFRAVAALAWLMPLAALVVAWRIDRRTQDAILPDHLLAAERGAARRIPSLLRAAMTGLPDSLFMIDRFVRARRACNTERVLGTPGGDVLCASISGVVAPLETRLQQPSSWQAAAAGWKNGAQRMLGRPATIVWAILALPSILWFVIGGSPATAGVQRQLGAGPGAVVVIALTIAAYAWLAWGLLAALRSWRRVLHAPLADSGAQLALGYMSGIGVLAFGVLAAWRGGPGATGSRALMSEAWEAIKQASPLANLAAALGNALNDLSKLHIRIPGTERAFITPGGPQKAAINAAVNDLLQALDRFGLRDAVKAARGPDVEEALTLDTHTEDPDDWSEVAGAITAPAAAFILGGALGAEAEARSLGRAIGRFHPEAKPHVDPFGKTQPGAHPHAETGAPPVSPKSPQATTLGTGGSPPTVETGGAPPRNWPRPTERGPVPEGEGAFQGDPALRQWLQNNLDHPLTELVGGPDLYHQADAAARSAYTGARNAGMDHQAARQSSFDAYHAYLKQGRGPVPKPLPSGGIEILTPETLKIDP